MKLQVASVPKCLTALLVVISLALTGCNSGEEREVKVAKVKGKVTLDGKALPEGYAIQFTSGESDVATKEISAIGEYEVDAPVGTCTVTIIQSGGDDDTIIDPETGMTKMQENVVPTKYQAEGEKFEVKADTENSFDLDMKG